MPPPTPASEPELSTSPSRISTPLSERLLALPRPRTRHLTLHPAARRVSISRPPMKPVAPVTRALRAPGPSVASAGTSAGSMLTPRLCAQRLRRWVRPSSTTSTGDRFSPPWTASLVRFTSVVNSASCSPKRAAFWALDARFLDEAFSTLRRGRGTPISLRRERPRAPSATPPASPAIAAPLASAGSFAFDAVLPIVRPALLVASVAVLRAESIRPAPLERLAEGRRERCADPPLERRCRGLEPDPELRRRRDEAARALVVVLAEPFCRLELLFLAVVLPPLRDEPLRPVELAAFD